jgi:transposase
LREVVAAKDAEIEALRAVKDAEIAELRALIGEARLRIAELERRQGLDSTNSGTPTSKESISARERRKAERRARRESSSRERRADRKPGGQPGHAGAGLRRDPKPDRVRPVDPPAECSSCGEDLADGRDAGTHWSQTWDIEIVKRKVEYRLPRRRCGCCGKVTTAAPPTGQPGAVSYGPNLNAAAIVLSSYGNVPTERAAAVIGMLLGMPVSPGFVDRACARLDERLDHAGFDEAMRRALLSEPVLGADESPVTVLHPDIDPGTGKPVEGSAQVMVIRTPSERLVWHQPLASRSAEAITTLLEGFTGYLIVDGYRVYQRLAKVLKGIQQCCQHVIRRCRQVAKLGPGGVQNWAGDIRAVLAKAHQAVEAAKAVGRTSLDPQLLADLRARYDKAVQHGITHNRHRDWHDGNHPGYTLARWLADYADQVWLFTTAFEVEWTNNASERAIKDPKRHQAVSGYWHTQHTLGRFCRIRSYLTSARNHGTEVVDAIHTALNGNPWLPTPATT